MISIFDAGNTDYSGNGDAVLMPTACSHRQVAAGKYDLTITHPMDPQGKWEHILPEAVIRAPVPEEVIETAMSGMAADVYITNTSAAMRSEPNEPTQITYSAWVEAGDYAVGSRVTFGQKNYQCTYYDRSRIEAHVIPSNSDWWVEIARWTSGAPVIVNLKSGTEVYYVEAAETEGWSKICTLYGLEGYVKDSQIDYDRTLTPEETQPRYIREQLFRVKKVTRSTDGMSVTATAEHVSYDLNGILIEDADIHQKNAAQALAWIEQAMMMDYQGTIATNMTDDEDGTYTGRITGKNATYALLDPDRGIVSSFGAMFRRDDWDVFVLRKTETDRGFQLRYRKNMLGVSWDMRSDGLITRVVPVAKAEDGSELYLDNDGVKWVDSPLIDEYPRIRMERIRVEGQVGKDDGTETGTTWTEETLRERMQEKAEERFSVDKVDQIVHEITVNFETLGSTDEYRALGQLERVLMNDTVTCIHETIGLSVTAEVTEIEYDCIRKKITALKLSNVNAYGNRSVSGFQVFNNSITGDKLTDDVNEGFRSQTASAVTEVQTWVTNNFVHR